MSFASYSIDLDLPRDLVRIRMSGFFNLEDISRFQAELKAAHGRLGYRDKPLTIIDISGMAIQTQEVTARWGAFLANPAHRSRRLAFVVAPTLARVQLKRALRDRDARVFSNTAEAEEWLFADEVSEAA